MKLLERVWRIVVDPHNEWARIAQESADAVFLAARYVAPLALIPAICAFVGDALVGVTMPDGATVREPIFAGLLAAAFGYLATFIVVFLVALVVDVLAPRFGGRRDFGSALKLAAYSFTPLWLTGIFLLLPGLRFLELLGCYGAYLIWTGLRVLMKPPGDRSPVYAAIVTVCAAGLLVLAAAVRRMLFA